MADEYLTVAEAQQRLGISKGRMAALINDRVIVAQQSPVDRRTKLIRKEDVERLLASGELSRRTDSLRHMLIRIGNLDGNGYHVMLVNRNGIYSPPDISASTEDRELVRWLNAQDEDWRVVATLVWNPVWTYAGQRLTDTCELLLESNDD